MEESSIGYATFWPACLIEQRLTPLGELLPGESIHVGSGWQKLKSLITSGHDIGGLHPGNIVEIVFRSEQAGFQVRGEEFPISRQIIYYIGHVHHGIRNSWKRSVYRADDIYLTLTGLCSSQHQIEQRAFF